MNNFSDADKAIQSALKSLIASIENPLVASHLRLRPRHLEAERETNKGKIYQMVTEMEVIYEEMLPLILNLKNSIESITEKTPLCASYLLFGRAAKSLKAAFLMAKNGMNYEMVELSRSIQEALGLVAVFITPESSEYLDKWFEGKIVPNRISRQVFDEFINSGELLPNGIAMKEAETFIYKLISQYPHSGYTALLESVNVYTKDFDFDNYTSLHFVVKNFHLVKSAMVSTLTALRSIYIRILQDTKTDDKIINIMDKIFPKVSQEEVAEILKQYKKT